MGERTIGEVGVTRIEELLGPSFPAAHLFPEHDPERLARHLGWMVPEYFDAASGRFVSSIHSWLVRTRHHTILVDCCAGADKERPAWPRFHRKRSAWLDNLRAAGVAPEAIDIVLCTHLHVDHVGWNTRLDNGRWVPTFPNARYLMARAEHDFLEAARRAPAAAADEDAIYRDSVLPVIEARQAVLLEGEHAIDDALRVEPAPGHTPGHVVLALESRGARAIFSGDIMHQPVQVYEPHWNSRFCEDAALARRTRRMLLERCAETDCLLLPAHFGRPHAGRIRRRGEHYAIEFSPSRPD